MHGLEDGRILWTRVRITNVDGRQLATHSADIARGGKSQATNEPCAHVGKDVTIQVGHDHYAIREGFRVRDNLCKRALSNHITKQGENARGGKRGQEDLRRT